MDSRINPSFLSAGAGFGGSCFPKDVSALKNFAKEIGEKPKLLDSVLEVNKSQPLKVVELLEKKAGKLKGKKIAVLGLAFKKDTDDVRESPSIILIDELKKKGAEVFAYDAKAAENMKKVHSGIHYSKTKEEAIEKSDAIAIMTDWDEFSEIETEKPVVDGRHIIKKEKRKENYEGLCW